jgi:spore coat polysaccharide biosynthesis protein SpsF
MNIVAIVQARMSSTRLPGKVLLPLGEDCALGYVIARLSQAKLVNHIVVATSVNHADNAIAYFCRDNRIHCLRGDEHNVLARYAYVASQCHADIIIRITADCPLVDYQLLDKMLAQFLAQSKSQYLSNVHPRTFPKGLDIEIFSAETLQMTLQAAKTAYELEHVTPYMYTSGQFLVTNYESDDDLSNYRWTLDTAEDYQFLKHLTAKLNNKKFLMNDILKLLKADVELEKLSLALE